MLIETPPLSPGSASDRLDVAVSNDSPLMHICFAALDYPSPTSGGGVGASTRALGLELRRSGCNVTVIALGAQGASVDSDQGIEVHRITTTNWHWYVSRIPLVGRHLALPIRELEYSWAAFRTVRALRKQQPIDIVECTETGTTFFAILMRRVLIIRLHGESYTLNKYTPGIRLARGVRLARAIQRFALRRARVLVSPSQSHAQEIAAELGRNRPPITVVSHGLPGSEIPTYIPTETETTGIDRPLPLRVLFAGRLELRKGSLVLIEAAREVVSQFSGVEFVLAGAWHPNLPRARIEGLIEAYSLGENVRLLGHVAREKLAELYTTSHIVVLPSYYETFGMSALEPMAYGLPVVASRAGALPEVVEDGVTGFLVGPGASSELAAAIVRLLNDSDLRSRMGRAARCRVEKHFKIDQHVGANLVIFNRLTSAA